MSSLKRVLYDPLCVPSLVVIVFIHNELQNYVNTRKTSFEEMDVMLLSFYQQMYFYLTHKILDIRIYIKTLFYSHSYMFRSVRTIVRESILSLAKVTFL
jgi:uncharacterized protein (UPF0248 family)